MVHPAGARDGAPGRGARIGCCSTTLRMAWRSGGNSVWSPASSRLHSGLLICLMLCARLQCALVCIQFCSSTFASKKRNMTTQCNMHGV